ncbi:MAG: FmdB family zinc ribbon protein [Phototrophicaceae bacterium]
MPLYTYRRADGSTFDYRQRFGDDPLTTCPTTGQSVNRVIHAAGIVFKGSGFYVNDSRGSKSSLSSSNPNPTAEGTSNATASSPTETPPPVAPSEPKSEAKAETASA